MSTTNWCHLLIKELITDAKTKESKIKYNQILFVHPSTQRIFIKLWSLK